MRPEALANRDRILTIARADFRDRGVQISLEDLAARAGVGIGTLYRRFPTRADLVAACYEPAIAAMADAAQAAAAEPDPWQGLASYISLVCQMQRDDRGLRDVFRMSFEHASGLDEARSRSTEAFLQLVGRAQADGSLRRDFVLQDLELLLVSNAAVVDRAAPDDAAAASGRLVALMLQAFRAGSHPPLPDPPRQRVLRRSS